MNAADVWQLGHFWPFLAFPVSPPFTSLVRPPLKAPRPTYKGLDVFQRKGM